MKDMRKVAENVRKENPDVSFFIVERRGNQCSVEQMIMKANPTESSECGRNSKEQRFVQIGNARKKTYDGQSLKNNFTRSGQHWTLYENWVRFEGGALNPKTGKRFAKPGTNSFLFNHQMKTTTGPHQTSVYKARGFMARIDWPAKWPKQSP